jgi:hypothetical protein
MTYQNLTTEPMASPVAVTKWLRGQPHPDGSKCVCCPEQSAHVFAYHALIADPDDLNWQSVDQANEPNGHLNIGAFVHDAIARMPEGTKFRIVVEPITED